MRFDEISFERVKCFEERGGHLGSLPQGEWATSVDAAESILATGLFDGTVKLWSTSMSFEGLRVLRGHRGPVTSVAFKDSKHLASGSFDRTARLWNVEARRPQETSTWKHLEVTHIFLKKLKES